jgi:hypothetical protein
MTCKFSKRSFLGFWVELLHVVKKLILSKVSSFPRWAERKKVGGIFKKRRKEKGKKIKEVIKYK